MTTGDDVVVAGAKLRALLAVLALHAGRVVPTDQFVDALWGEDPPAAVRNGLQGLASKLRRTLGSADLVVMRGGGYVARAAAGRRSTSTATSSSSPTGGRPSPTAIWTGPSTLLAEADSLWRGDPLADFAYEDFAAATITRLSELRLALIEERLDLELAARSPPAAVVAARGARRRASAARAAARAADARAVPRRAAGRRPAGLPGGSSAPGRGARARTRSRAPRVGVGDPGPGPVARRAAASPSRDRSPARVAPDDPGSADPAGRPRRGAARPHASCSPSSASSRSWARAGWARPASRSRWRAPRPAALAFGGCLVELAPVGDPAGVRAAIAAALDLPDPSRLAEMIGDRSC